MQQFTEEHKQKLRDARKVGLKSGKIKIWSKGKKFTEEHKNHLSEAHMGIPGYWAGKKRPEVTSWKKGTHVSNEQKKKISASLKGRLPWNKGKKLGPISEEHKLKIRKSLSTTFRNRPTKIEKMLYDELDKRGIEFERQYLLKNKFLVDAYIQNKNIVIEVDGIYWHSLSNNIKRDKSRNAYLLKCGYKLLRLPEANMHDGSFKKILDDNIDD